MADPDYKLCFFVLGLILWILNLPLAGGLSPCAVVTEDMKDTRAVDSDDEKAPFAPDYMRVNWKTAAAPSAAGRASGPGGPTVTAGRPPAGLAAVSAHNKTLKLDNTIERRRLMTGLGRL